MRWAFCWRSMHEIVSGVLAMSSLPFQNMPPCEQDVRGECANCFAVHSHLAAVLSSSYCISRAKLVACPWVPYSLKLLHLSVVFEDKVAEMRQILILFTVFPPCVTERKFCKEVLLSFCNTSKSTTLFRAYW